MSIAIGTAITGGANNEVLYIDNSGNLACSSNLTFDGQKFSVSRTSANASSPADGAIYSTYSYALSSTDVSAAVFGYFTNSGSNTSSGGHGIGVLGYCVDTTSGAFDLYGTEGRVNPQSANRTYTGLTGQGNWADPNSNNTTTFSGNFIGVSSLMSIYAHNGTTPRQQGTIFGFYAAANVGGQYNYGMLIEAQTSGQYNIGLAIRTASTYTLQVGSDVDGTSANGGIYWGTSADTNLYRSTTSTLKTDSSLIVSGTLTAASGRQVPSAIHPGVASSRYYMGVASTPTFNGVALTANLLYFCPIFVPERTTYTEIGIRVTTAVAASNLQLAIYKASGGVPTTLVTSTSNISSATTGAKTASISQQLEAGLYYVAVSSGAAISVNFVVDYAACSIVGATTDNGAEQLVYSSGTFGTWPNNPTISYAAGSGSVPAVWLRK